MHLTKRNKLILFFTVTTILLLTFGSKRTSTHLYNDESDNLAGNFIEKRMPTKISYCKFNYNLPNELNYTGKDVHVGPELGRKGNHRVIYNVTQARLDKNVPGVTYATHVTTDFLNFIPELVRYWEGPISIAIFVPDLDVAVVLEQVVRFCYCLPEMTRVSIHFVYDKNVPPSRRDTSFAVPATCKRLDTYSVKSFRDFDESVIYPINVCRNVAKQAALTEYVLVSDVQLMPSRGLATGFMQMLNKSTTNFKPETAFVLPIFEVEETEKLPRTKSELVHLLHANKSVYFHGMVCKHCQKFPGIEDWISRPPKDVIEPFTVAKREDPYHRWEPIFIGKKSFPLYNEALSWEGLQDKMAQMLEMCLIGYDFVILDGAFLAHWPGIKKSKVATETWRFQYINKNIGHYKNILTKLLLKYKINPNCRVETAALLGQEQETKVEKGNAISL